MQIPIQVQSVMRGRNKCGINNVKQVLLASVEDADEELYEDTDDLYQLDDSEESL